MMKGRFLTVREEGSDRQEGKTGMNHVVLSLSQNCEYELKFRLMKVQLYRYRYNNKYVVICIYTSEYAYIYFLVLTTEKVIKARTLQ